jgi:hypothetical protein
VFVTTSAVAHRPNPDGVVIEDEFGPNIVPPQYASPGPTPSGTWSSIEATNPYPGKRPTTALMLTDGSVIIQDQCTPRWYRLIPDGTGEYATGSWTAYAPGDRANIAPMPGGYGPLYYASQVMNDARVIVQGGEYENSINGCQGASWSNRGAVYDPYFDVWSALPPPVGWNNIGDAASVVLEAAPATFNSVPTGLYMVANPTGNCNGPPVTYCEIVPGLDRKQAILTALTPAAKFAPPPTLIPTWKIVGQGKADANDEEGWVLLPNGMVLTVDMVDASGTVPPQSPSEEFNPKTKSWSNAGAVPIQLVEPTAHEIGPGVLTPYGTVFWVGAFTGTIPDTFPAHTAIFTPGKGWIQGPDFPVTTGISDGPAALLVSGNILIQTRACPQLGSGRGWRSHRRRPPGSYPNRKENGSESDAERRSMMPVRCE